MQDLNILDQSGIDEIPGCVGEAADIEVIRKRNSIDNNGHSVTANSPDVDPFGPEAGTGPFVIDARHIAKHVTNRGGEIVVQFCTGQDRYVCGDFPNRALVLVRDNDDLVD